MANKNDAKSEECTHTTRYWRREHGAKTVVSRGYWREKKWGKIRALVRKPPQKKKTHLGVRQPIQNLQEHVSDLLLVSFHVLRGSFPEGAELGPE
jgi:hypothetical protein